MRACRGAEVRSQRARADVISPLPFGARRSRSMHHVHAMRVHGRSGPTEHQRDYISTPPIPMMEEGRRVDEMRGDDAMVLRVHDADSLLS